MSRWVFPVLLRALLLAISLLTGAQYCSAQQYQTESAELGRLVQQYDVNDKQQPPAHELGLGHYYEGDIMLPSSTDQDRLSISEEYSSTIWPNAIVPYRFAPGDFTPREIRRIETQMNVFRRKTCVRFVPRTALNTQYVTITSHNAGCYASLGRMMNNSQNVLNLQTPACLTGGTPVHEMMHVLGFLHEMSRPDRDEYLRINRSALRPEYQTDEFYATNFGKQVEGVETYNISYNYGSVMHYSRYAGAQSRQYPVLENLKPYDEPDFGNTTLSQSDIESVKFRYCKNRTATDTFKYIFNPTLNPMIRIFWSGSDAEEHVGGR